MLDIFWRLLNVILPTRPGTTELKKENPEKFGRRFFSPVYFANCISLANYNEELVRLAINANKFHSDKHASKLLSSLLECWLKTQLQTTDKKIILVPVPLSKKRERERGYNQVTKIINNLATNERILVKNLLNKTKDTPPQTRLNKQKRALNVTDVFSITSPNKALSLSSCFVVLVDDVITTGATLKAAKKSLQPHLPTDCKLVCLAIAH